MYSIFNVFFNCFNMYLFKNVSVETDSTTLNVKFKLFQNVAF